MSLYLNGTLDGTTTHAVPSDATTNAGLDAGRYRDGSWLGTTGGTMQLGEVRTWRRALSAAEVTQLAVRPTTRYAFSESAIASTSFTTTANACSPSRLLRLTAL